MSVELLLSLIAERYPLREHHAGKYTAIAGGPGTDCFMQMKGREFTEKMFRDVFFATGNGKV